MDHEHSPPTCAGVYRGTYLVDEKAEDRFLLNVDEVVPEDNVAGDLLFIVNPSTNRSNIGPKRVHPSVAKKELVLEWVQVEPDIAIVEHS